MFTAESLQSKLIKQTKGGSFLLFLHFIWLGIQKRSIQSPGISLYKWEIPVHSDQKETKA